MKSSLPVWKLSSTEFSREVGVDPDRGLRSDIALHRLKEFGPNVIAAEEVPSLLSLIIHQFKSPMVYLLFLAGLIAFFLGERWEALAIFVIILLNGLIGFVQEYQAEHSLEALRGLTSPRAKVLRDGDITQVESKLVVPGDVLLLEAGDLVTADARLIEARQLTVNESILTGESLSVEKEDEVLVGDVALGERRNMVFSGTAVDNGTGKAIVVATGESTEMGKIAGLLKSAPRSNTPLQKKLEAVSQKLLWLGLILIFIVVILEYRSGKLWRDILMSAMALAVAAIPEGLPTVVTLAMVMAIRRLSKKKALVRKMDSVETLGSTDVICTDKTGTLTTGRMTVAEAKFDVKDREIFLHSMVLCNNATGGSGDSTEVALIEWAKSQNVHPKILNEKFPRLFEWSFESGRKRMSVAVSVEGAIKIFTKGAPESVLACCLFSEEDKVRIQNEISGFSKKGMRVLGFAEREIPPGPLENLRVGEIEQGLKFLGLVAMRDPLRSEVPEAVESCRVAGIRIIMMTGDHPETARAIAQDLGLTGADGEVVTGKEMDALTPEELDLKVRTTSVFARVSPENKLSLVRTLSAQGHVVAMTGDGVNDAPALKTADIGVAMGQGGTEVARQASSLILTDDNFATIVHAVEEGRVVHGNIRRSLHYLLSTNLAEIIFITSAITLDWPRPFSPVNLLWLNLVTDGIPALVLATEKVPRNYLRESGRPSPAKFFDQRFLIELFVIGLIIAAANLLVFAEGLERGDLLHARSMSFAFMIYVILFQSLYFRSDLKTVFEMVPSGRLILAIVIPVLIQFGLQELPYFQQVFGLTSLSLSVNLTILGLALVPLLLSEVYKFSLNRFLKS